MAERGQGAADGLAIGGDEASVVVGRLLSVAQAGHERSAHLQRALESRIVIEQAKGVLSERFELDVDQAFDLLRRAARSRSLRIRDLAQTIVSSRETPPPIMAQLAKEWTRSENGE